MPFGVLARLLISQGLLTKTKFIFNCDRRHSEKEEGRSILAQLDRVLDGPRSSSSEQKSVRTPFVGELNEAIPRMFGAYCIDAWDWEARSVDAASDKKQAASTQKLAAANPADFVGSETCTTCHAEVAKKFGDNPHSRLALMHDGKGATCESCHGPGKAHVEGGGDVTKIFRFSKASAQQIDATCLGCHEGAHPDFERSPMARRG